MAAVSLVTLTIPLTLKGLLLALILVSWRYHRGGVAQGSRRFIRTLDLQSDGSWSLGDGVGLKRTAWLTGCYVHPSIVLLNFSLTRWTRRSVILLADSADPESIRRLRVRLRTDPHLFPDTGEPPDP
ncbi:MAG: hypothetical protein H6970_00365 [Gammaproteobacteria bacterium]|nr:hypothetical protein [Gammaproteobacteria bacterium]MCP5423513.1 hypothetical protein [Gammaproteobacteria bacterium]